MARFILLCYPKSPIFEPRHFFYWDFLERHLDQLKSLGRMNLVLGNFKRMQEEELDQIRSLAQDWRQNSNNQKTHSS